MKCCVSPQCKLAGKKLPSTHFYKNKSAIDGLYAKCKECVNAKHKIYTIKNIKQIKKYKNEWYVGHRLQNKENHKDSTKKWKAVHLQHIKWYNHRYQAQHKDEINIRNKERIKTDIKFKISKNLRNKVNQSIRRGIFGGYKYGSAIRDLGCTISELLKYIELKFQPGMSWDNYGSGTSKWNIDHIIPLNSFDLTIREQFLKACYYQNLQPLWSVDNFSKGCRMIN